MVDRSYPLTRCYVLKRKFTYSYRVKNGNVSSLAANDLIGARRFSGDGGGGGESN